MSRLVSRWRRAVHLRHITRMSRAQIQDELDGIVAASAEDDTSINDLAALFVELDRKDRT